MLYLQYISQGPFFHDYEVRCKKFIISPISTRTIRVGEPVARVRFLRSQDGPPRWFVLNEEGNGFKVNDAFESSRDMLDELRERLGVE